MYAMLTQKLSKGFKSWSDMLKENKDKLDRHGMTLIYAGSHADDDNSMIAIIHWESKEGMMSFKNDEELKRQEMIQNIEQNKFQQLFHAGTIKNKDNKILSNGG